MNTVQIECFLSVFEHLNFSHASEALKISQPAVSHQIQTLEEELGVKLFKRTSKSVTITPEGIQFLPDAELILKTVHSAKERLGKHENLIHFDIGCHNHLELNLLPALFQKLTKEFPLLRPSPHLAPTPSLLGLVENQKLIAALGIKEHQKKSALFFRELCSAPMACICYPEHPMSQYDSVTTDMLTGSFVACSPRQIHDTIFTIQNSILAGLPPQQRYVTGSIESAFTLAKARFGYTLYPDIPRARVEGLRYIPVTGLPQVTFGVYYQQKNDHPVLRRFLTLLTQSVQS